MIHFGYVFCFCVEKNAELQPEHRKHEGRAVFQGNKVVDQNWDVAMFQDLGSSPANMDASRAAADCYGRFPGRDIEIADAEQPPAQRKHKGRAVLQGNQVVDQDWDVATFQDLGSSPANMDASRAADLWLLPWT